MSAIPETQRKLRDAHATFRLLQASARAIPLNHEECHRQLSAFLSETYSVVDVMQDEIGKPWVDRWWSKRSVEDRAEALHAGAAQDRSASPGRRYQH